MRKVYDRSVIKAVMDECGVTQQELADMMGYRTQSAVSQITNRKRCSLEKVVAALNKMGCELIVTRNNVALFEIVTDWEIESRED